MKSGGTKRSRWIAVHVLRLEETNGSQLERDNVIIWESETFDRTSIDDNDCSQETFQLAVFQSLNEDLASFRKLPD